MVYDELTQTIEIMEQVAGNYTIVFKLTDAQGAVTSSEVTFEILEPELEEEENTGIDFNFALDILDVFAPDPFEFEPSWETTDNNITEKVIEEICKA